MSAAGRRLGRLMTQSVEPDSWPAASIVRRWPMATPPPRSPALRIPVDLHQHMSANDEAFAGSCIFGDSHFRVRQADALNQGKAELVGWATQLDGPEDQAMECMTGMSKASDSPFGNVLDPMERISETLFGLIMVLTFICSLGVATSGNIQIQTMLVGSLGCNLSCSACC